MNDTKDTETKTEAELLKEKLFYENKNTASDLEKSEFDTAFRFCEGYKSFLESCKTERKATAFFTEAAKARGFTPFDSSKTYSAGDKVFFSNRGKALILAVFGKKPVADGLRITAAHIDSPRLDLKPCPLYEDSETAYFKTHYYGGIKKYQWTAIPLALFGIVALKDGGSVEVNIGADKDDPLFTVTDLLPHLAKEQMQRTLAEGIKGEELNLLAGSRPFDDCKGSELVKLNIMKILNEKYGIVEADLISAELEAVPAFPVSDIGLDRSLIGGYGHDDRVCAYPAAMSLFDCGVPEYTALCALADKEEVGSMGCTGLESSFLRYVVEDIAQSAGANARDVLRASLCLSADVNAAFDPSFPSTHDKLNAALINHGIVVTKYLGSRGKGGSSDANAEFLAYVRHVFDESGVFWQSGEMGKVDEGGGGTVAQYVANLGVEVVDVGVPVLSMHSPFEVVSKLDVYAAYRAFGEFSKR